MYRDVLKEWSVEVDVEKPKQTYHYICFYIFFTFYFGFKEHKPFQIYFLKLVFESGPNIKT